MARALDRFGPLPDQLERNLARFVALLSEWQRVHNLVGRSELADIWQRHVADSLQLLKHAPAFRSWVDLGSGAGFPGFVIAAAFRGDASRSFTLVEANGKKAAFLRTAVRELGLNATVAAERIEAHSAKAARTADVVSARALASLRTLFELAHPYLHEDSTMLLLKGQDFAREVDEARESWSFDVVSSVSETDSAGRVLIIRDLRPGRGQ